MELHGWHGEAPVDVMQALAEKNGMSLKELGSAVGMAHSTVSGIVDRLEKRGMLERLT
jgi:DNA-binding MarR family transcriptional regulator